MHPGGLISYFTVCVRPALGLTASMPLKTTMEETARFCGVCSFAVWAAMPTVIVMVCSVFGLLPFFRLPPNEAMVQTMLFTGWLLTVAATGAAQATGSVAGALETAVTLVIPSCVGSEMVELNWCAVTEPVLVATKVWVVVAPVLSVGFAELAVTVTVSVGPTPPCGGAPGVNVLRVAVPVEAPALAVKFTVLVIGLVWSWSMKLTLTEAPGAIAPMVQVTGV